MPCLFVRLIIQLFLPSPIPIERILSSVLQYALEAVESMFCYRSAKTQTFVPRGSRHRTPIVIVVVSFEGTVATVQCYHLYFDRYQARIFNIGSCTGATVQYDHLYLYRQVAS